jgi:DNA mismatch repair protein MutS
MNPSLTPLLNQYYQIKKNYPDQIVFFRMGDFYEMFGEDARIASEILGIALTSRSHGKKAERVPLAGVPYHAADRYLARLLQAGKKVVVCEQTEAASPEKKLVNRAVVEIITPGTITVESVLDSHQANYLASLYQQGEESGLAYVELSTGEFRIREGDTFQVLERLKVISPAEILVPRGSDLVALNRGNDGLRASLTELEPWKFDLQSSTQLLLRQFQVNTLAGFGCQDSRLGIIAAGVILDYLKLTKKTILSHLTRLTLESDQDLMFLDASTIRNLELFPTEERPNSLFTVLNRTQTSMGARLLKNWIARPLLQVNQIKQRQEALEELVKKQDLLQRLAELLSEVSDLFRLTGKIGYGKANPKDLLNLKNSLGVVPEIRKALRECQAGLNVLIREELPDCTEVIQLIGKSIVDDPPANTDEGGLIREGFDPELDRLKAAISGSKKWIAGLQAEERERTGINSLKVGFTQVFGYYIEVTTPHLAKVPVDYLRKQTLVNAERFITQELKEKEELILNAEQIINRKEAELFLQIRNQVAGYAKQIQKTAELLSTLDVLCSLAEVAVDCSYVKSEVNEGDQILIEEGRHPVLEGLLPSGSFIPNDTLLNNSDQQIHIITGPNMAGKSTYLRQTGLIVLMAQMGSFVPAGKASIGIVDRIFTRVGAMDNIAVGQSTFLVEMNETANILHNATSRSLILLDEVGRGTSTFDGLSIAWAVTEYIHNNPKVSAKTLFATHYHELTELADFLPRVKNYKVAVKEWQGEVVFLHKIIPGGCDDSYGIQVAKLAGIPREVLTRATEILAQLEEGEVTVKKIPPTKVERLNQLQIALSSAQSGPVEKELSKLDLEKLTPLEALNKIAEWKKRLRK